MKQRDRMLFGNPNDPEYQARLKRIEESQIAHEKWHKDHAGHENMHAIMLMILLLTLIIAQIAIVFWKKNHFKSYQMFSLIGLLTVPLAVCVWYGWFRFVFIWAIFCVCTWFYGNRAIQKHISGQTPRMVYRYFYYIHMISAALSVVGYLLFLFTLCGLPLVFSAQPESFLDSGLLMMFYGLYYGVVGRDLADLCTDKMASQIGYYSKTGLPRLKLGNNICAACGNPVDLQNDLMPLSEETPREYNEWTSPEERVVVLNCRHIFHEFCLRGWCIVGKKETCPYCKEKVNLKEAFPNPWEKPHVLFGNLIDLVRYLIVWQPLIFAIVKAIIWTSGLK